AFGGVVALTRTLDQPTAEQILAVKTDVVLAPGYTDESLQLLARRQNLRVIEVGRARMKGYDVRSVPGGFLAQSWDRRGFHRNTFRVGSRRQPTPQEWEQLEFAWLAVKHVKSNAIVIARDFAAVGVGAGQMSRVEAAQIAVERAGDRVQGAVMASDAFFPFADGVEVGLKAGVTAGVPPGGSGRGPGSRRAVGGARAARGADRRGPLPHHRALRFH